MEIINFRYNLVYTNNAHNLIILLLSHQECLDITNGKFILLCRESLPQINQWSSPPYWYVDVLHIMTTLQHVRILSVLRLFENWTTICLCALSKWRKIWNGWQATRPNCLNNFDRASEQWSRNFILVTRLITLHVNLIRILWETTRPN